MTDIYDRATDLEEAQREDALQAQQRRAQGHGINAGKTVEDSFRACRLCDAKIPMARRRAIPGVQTCIDCQHDLEREIKGSARHRF